MIFHQTKPPANGTSGLLRYARDGRVLKGSERALTKSKYEEDVLIGPGCGLNFKRENSPKFTGK
jgi:hypothetical protein